MSFSQNWELSYRQGSQNSLWPWEDVVRLFSLYTKNVEHVRVLELGCGSGANVRFFGENSEKYSYYGVDGSPTVVERLRSWCPYKNCDFGVADFSLDFGVQGPFDVIFDRASLPHNDLDSIKATIDLAKKQLASAGLYIGVHWFSNKSSYLKDGVAVKEETTRDNFHRGLFVRIGPDHFFSREKIEQLFDGFTILYIKHIDQVKDVQ